MTSEVCHSGKRYTHIQICSFRRFAPELLERSGRPGDSRRGRNSYEEEKFFERLLQYDDWRRREDVYGDWRLTYSSMEDRTAIRAGMRYT